MIGCFRCNPAEPSHPIVLQCIITAPRRCSQESSPSTSGGNALLNDPSTGDLRLRNATGTTVIFDSFSPAEEVRRRNPVTNSISRLNDPSRHFLTGFNVSVTGPVAAILSTDTVEGYQKVERKAPQPPPVTAKRPMIITEFDLEIERRKRQCALLFRDTSVSLSSSPPTIVSLAETLLSMKDQSTSFADVLRGSPPNTSEESAAISALCAFHRL